VDATGGKRVEYDYDRTSLDPRARGNLLAVREIADPGRGLGSTITGLSDLAGTNTTVLENPSAADQRSRCRGVALLRRC